MHSPSEMAMPPYIRIKMGVGAFSDTKPLVPMSHSDINGPIALLQPCIVTK